MTTTQDWSPVAKAWGAQAEDVEAMKEPVTSVLLAGLRPEPGDVVLEVGAGTGELARQLAARVAPGGRVFATDAAPGMVEVMQQRLAGVAGVEVRTCEASATGLADGQADGVVARMSLMFSLEPETAVAEAFRVLKPGGRYAAATWAGPFDNMWMASVGMAAAMNGLMDGGGPMGPGKPFSLSEPKQLLALLEDAGFTDVEVTDIPIEIRFADTDAHFAHVTALAGPMAVAISEAPEDVREAVRQSAADNAARFADADGLLFPGLARVVTGVRP